MQVTPGGKFQMNDLALVLAVALLPGVGNIAGGLLAESLRAPPWIIRAALHAAAGIAIAVVSVELMPRILEETPVWFMVTGFLAGAGLSVLLARSLRY
jgi:ZIP family zinc transporter